MKAVLGLSLAVALATGSSAVLFDGPSPDREAPAWRPARGTGRSLSEDPVPAPLADAIRELATASARSSGRRAPAPPVVRDACVSDHNETDNDLPFEELLGKEDFQSDAPFDGPSTNAAIGIGGGDRGSFRGRGGRRSRITALDEALAWLKAQQNEDGSWGTTPRETGLALLAFLHAGNTHKHGEYKKTVKAGLKYLKAGMTPEGDYAAPGSPTYLLDHTIATLAFAEAYSLTASPLFKACSNLALARIAAEHESVGAWTLLALETAKTAGLTIDEKALARFRQRPGTFGCEAALARILSGETGEAAVGPAHSLLLSADRSGDPRDADLIFFSVAACFATAPAWNAEWRAPVFSLLKRTRVTLGDEAGSWDPAGGCGDLFGRIGTTAMLTSVLGYAERHSHGRIFGTR